MAQKGGVNISMLELEDLTRNELIELCCSYNDYVINFLEEHEDGMTPVSIYEYLNNEFYEHLNNIKL